MFNFNELHWYWTFTTNHKAILILLSTIEKHILDLNHDTLDVALRPSVDIRNLVSAMDRPSADGP